MQSDRGNENDRLLREAEERIRQRRAALGIEGKVPLVTVEPAPPSSPPGRASNLPPYGTEPLHFTQDSRTQTNHLTHTTRKGHTQRPPVRPGRVEMGKNWKLDTREQRCPISTCHWTDT
jgi:hypothetical protein